MFCGSYSKNQGTRYIQCPHKQHVLCNAPLDVFVSQYPCHFNNNPLTSIRLHCLVMVTLFQIVGFLKKIQF